MGLPPRTSKNPEHLPGHVSERAQKLPEDACRLPTYEGPVTFARADLTNCLPVYIFNARGITAVAAWRTLRIGKRAKPVAEFGMMLVVGQDRPQPCAPLLTLRVRLFRTPDGNEIRNDCVHILGIDRRLVGRAHLFNLGVPLCPATAPVERAPCRRSGRRGNCCWRRPSPALRTCDHHQRGDRRSRTSTAAGPRHVGKRRQRRDRDEHERQPLTQHLLLLRPRRQASAR